jgi:hypothetical protein
MAIHLGKTRIEWTGQNSYGLIGSKYISLLPLFVSLFASSFQATLACALTLCSEMGAIRFCSIFTIDFNIVLSR